MKFITLDYETYYDKQVSVRTLGAGQYAAHPQNEIYLLSVCDGHQSWVGHPRDFTWSVLEDYDGMVSYNALFEQSMTEIGLPRMGIDPGPALTIPWYDASDLGTYVMQTTNLNATIKKAYGQSLDKAARGSMEGKTWDQCADQARMTEYARRDSWWTHKFFMDHVHKWPAWEQNISQITRYSSRRGVWVNRELLGTYLAAAEEELFNIEKTLPWVDDGDKPTSSKAIAAECRKTGIPCPPVKDKDEEGFLAWEQQFSPRHAWIKQVSRWRSVNMILGQLRVISWRIREDDTMETPLRYFGACSTGRWSGDGGFNFQNIRKVPILCAGVMIDMRKLFGPRPGYKMFVADLAQIEPRVLNWMVGNETMLEMMRKGMSPYEAFARTNLGWRGGKLKEEDPKQYDMVKVMVLGLGYGAGAERFIGMADSLSGGKIKLTLEESRATVDKFRAAAPLICDKDNGMWAVLDREFKKAANTDGTFEFELPSGRVITYPNIRKGVRSYPEQREVRRMVDGQWQTQLMNVPRKKQVFLVQVDGRTKAVYGGLLTENVTQAAARDVFCLCYENLVDANLHVPFTVHDEAVIEAPMDTKKSDIEELMSVKPEWMPGIPVEADVKEVPHYLKQH